MNNFLEEILIESAAIIVGVVLLTRGIIKRKVSNRGRIVYAKYEISNFCFTLAIYCIPLISGIGGLYFTLMEPWKEMDGATKATVRSNIILVVLFCATIPVIPLLFSVFHPKEELKKKNNTDIKGILRAECSELSEALQYLKMDYDLEYQNTWNTKTTSTFTNKQNSSLLIRIESKDNIITKIY